MAQRDTQGLALIPFKVAGCRHREKKNNVGVLPIVIHLTGKIKPSVQYFSSKYNL
jgi:hypothetical protein